MFDTVEIVVRSMRREHRIRWAGASGRLATRSNGSLKRSAAGDNVLQDEPHWHAGDGRACQFSFQAARHARNRHTERQYLS